MAEWTPLAEVGLQPPFAHEVAAWRQAFAAQAGRRWALYFHDARHFAAALYGAWHAGKEVWLPADVQAQTQAALRAQVDGWAGDLPGALAADPAAEPLSSTPLDLDTTSLTVFTSGSSGEPVAVPKRLRQLDAEVQALEAAFGAQLGAGPLQVHATVSHQHIYGLLFAVLWPLAAGRARAAQRIDYPEQIGQRLADGAGVLVASPAHLTRLPDGLDGRAARASLRAVFSSGGPLPDDAAARTLERLGQAPIEVYGSTETGGIAWRQRASSGDGWTLLPGVEWRLDGERLAVRSPHLPDTDWFVTEDRVLAAGAGFALQGRADRIVKLEEKRVSLAAVEQGLRACPEVADARVLLVDAAGGRERLGAVVVPTPQGVALLAQDGKRALSERLRQALLERVERVALPRRWRFVQRLPVDPQGKSTQALLRVLFRAERPEPRWLDVGDAHAALELAIDPALRVFDGHFDTAAVLPGVAQLDWAIGFARQRFPLPARFARVDALKFQRPIVPGLTVRLELQWQAERGQLAFQYASERGPHASGRVLFEDEHAL